MSYARVVRVTAGSEGMGSGYLLTPQYALTARHVFGEKAKPGQRCTLAPLADAQGAAAGTDFKGKLAWLPKDASLDLAVVRLDKPVPGLSGVIELARIAPNSGEALAVSGTGFPQAVDDASHTFRGLVNFEPIEQLLVLSVSSALPKLNEDWSGASGTVLLSQERAIGVVATVDLRFNGQLSVVPVQRLLQAGGFAAWWSQQGLSPLTLRSLGAESGSALEEIVAQIHWLDREQPFQQAQAHIETATQTRRPLPRLVFVPGRAHDLHRHLIQRIAESSRTQRLLGRHVAPQDLLVNLPWPAVCEPGDLALAELLTPLYDAARLPSPDAGQLGDSASLSALALAQALDNQVTPNAWWTQLNRAVGGPGAGALLQSLIQFWSCLPVRRPLFLFVCLALDEPPAKPKSLLGFLSHARPADTPAVEAVLEAALQERAEQVLFLDELEPIVSGHVNRWVSQSLANCQRSSAQQLAVFEAELAQRLGSDGLPLEPIVAMLPAVLAAATLHRPAPP